MYRVRHLWKTDVVVTSLVIAVAMAWSGGWLVVQAQPAVQTVVDAHVADRDYLHAIWTIEDGLPQNSVNDILQTRDGYLWLATFGGVARFDGVTFTVFDEATAPGLASNRMLSLFEDQAGTLWIGHETGEVNAYRNGVFTSYDPDDGLSKGSIYAFSQGEDGTLWIGTGQGIVRFRDGVFTTYTTADGLPSNQVFDLLVDRQGRLWMGTDAGVACLEDGRFTVYDAADGLPGLIVGNLYEDRNGILWVGTSLGLTYYREGRFIAVMPGEEGAWPVRSIGEDHRGGLWVGKGAGHQLVRLEGATPLPGNAPEITVRLAIGNRNQKSLFIDQEANIWVGTDGEGLHRFREKPITRFTTEDGLAQISVFRVVGDDEGGVWFNAGCDNLTQFSEATLSTYSTLPDGGKIGCVWSLLRDRAGVLWAGTDHGLIRWAGPDYTYFTSADGLPEGHVVSLFEDREGTLWIGTGENGVARYDGETFRTYSTQDGLVHNDVRYIMQGQDGALWFGTREGVSCLRNGVFSNYTVEDGLSPGMVRVLHQDADGIIWVGTYGGGLSRLKGGVVTRYTLEVGLLDYVVSHIL